MIKIIWIKPIAVSPKYVTLQYLDNTGTDKIEVLEVKQDVLTIKIEEEKKEGRI